MLYHEKLDVYQAAIQLTALFVQIGEALPKGYAALAEQLRRAAMSIPLSIAEGVGKPTPAETARFHGIARGFAMECGAILDVMHIEQGSVDSTKSAKARVVRIVEMLSRMCR
ncbi:MAG: four helix bundle protein [Myxococcales bacterium]